MNKPVEKEILAEIENSGSYSAIQCTKISASVCMKWIEKAFRAGENYEYGSQFGPVPNNRPDLKKWLELNGLTPTEPDTK